MTVLATATMTRRGPLLLALAAPSLARAQAAPRVEVWKDRYCGCCDGWIVHMRRAGFAVAAQDRADMPAIKRAQGVPDALWSCHTARIEDYVLEGHVPPADVRRLLAEHPAAKGLAVPGMPAAAPGMDMPGEAYEVILFGLAGDAQRVFARHG